MKISWLKLKDDKSNFNVFKRFGFDVFDVDKDIDAIMLCSDGLTNMLTVSQIEKVLNETDLKIEDKLIKIIKKCNARGGTDNISIAYLVKDGGVLW